MTLSLFHVDAFASQAFRGNPAAVCPLDRWLDDDFLRAVAAENNLSETAYFVPRDGAYELRWFTPRCEVRLCGHATLASAFVLLNILDPSLESVHFKTRYSGTLTVRRKDDWLAMDFPTLPPEACFYAPDNFGRMLGEEPVAVLEKNNKYIPVYKSEDAIREIRPNFTLLGQLHPYTVAATAPGRDCDFVSRYFAPSYGVPEDPVTGSSHCALTPYWAEQLGKKRLHARQLSERGGELWCELAGDRVLLEGKAVLTLKGTLMV
jgi:PhzF family phenazine biosynthesis protein